MRLLLYSRGFQGRHYKQNEMIQKNIQRMIISQYSSSSSSSSTVINNNFPSTTLNNNDENINNSNNNINLLTNNKILIANRGEIACRVIRTCKRMGIPSVAIYSNEDGKDSLHAAMADESYCIGNGPTPSESYLLMDEVIEIAKESNAGGIHPGYGFLSENSIFAQKCSQNKINFIGPPINAIKAMGSKSESKEIMLEANVPIVPGYNGSNQDNDFLYDECVNNIGFPCLIKATMGGGGKGMRLVHSKEEFHKHLESCQRESLSSFGNSSVIIEKYLTNPRHIEYQIFGDMYGNVVHLYERDCSIQRRHQKVIEEAPASDLSNDIRNEMGDVSVRAAKAIGYVGAGTVEFLLDGSSSSVQDNKFYFCEMNTRLQVEHPITEMITGYDLVEWQIRVASGETLPIIKQNDINEANGHAIECRIYAENPYKDFLPATGKLHHIKAPNNTRVDTGVQKNDNISVYYDPMISKLIVHDKTRKEAIKKMIYALHNYQIVGVTTNIPFLLKCMQHHIYQKGGDGSINTNFLIDYENDLKLEYLKQQTPSLIGQSLFALYILLHLEKRIGINDLLHERKKCNKSPWSNIFSNWSIHGSRIYALHFGNGDDDDDNDDNITTIQAISNSKDGSFRLTIPNNNDQDDEEKQTFIVNGTLTKEGLLNATINQKKFSVTTFCQDNLQSNNNITMPISLFTSSTATIGKNEEYSCHWSYLPNYEICKNNQSSNSNSNNEQQKSSGTQTIKSPMPGKVIKINTSLNDKVQSGDVLIMLEAMKMEHSIHATTSGIVSMLQCNVGDIVADGAILASIDSSSSLQV